MKSVLALIVYGLLGCSLSLSQASLFQESKLILQSLKQLDLQQLMEIKIATQTKDEEDEQEIACQEKLPTQKIESAANDTTTDTQAVVGSECESHSSIFLPKTEVKAMSQNQ